MTDEYEAGLAPRPSAAGDRGEATSKVPGSTQLEAGMKQLQLPRALAEACPHS